jgi:hypothetical protein
MLLLVCIGMVLIHLNKEYIMAKLIHRLRIEVWLRGQIAEIGESDFYTELFAALVKIQQTQVEAIDPETREIAIQRKVNQQ